MQVTWGVLLGGPVALIYFLRANFLALGNREAATKTILYGLLGTVAMTALLFILPDNIPTLPFALVYVFSAKALVEKYQKTKQDIVCSLEYGFHSNGRVFGFGVICFLGTLILVGLLVVLFAYLLWVKRVHFH